MSLDVNGVYRAVVSCFLGIEEIGVRHLAALGLAVLSHGEYHRAGVYTKTAADAVFIDGCKHIDAPFWLDGYSMPKRVAFPPWQGYDEKKETEETAMLVRVPDYYEDFRCLAGQCPHSCCEKWEVVIDPETAQFYQEVPGDLGEKLRGALQRDEEGDLCFPLNGGRCPFLDGENLCEIHKKLGQEATSITCQAHPRFTEDYGPFREVTLCASCPAANALLLGSREPLRFLETKTEEPEEEGDDWLSVLVPLREKLLAILAERALPLRTRLKSFLLLAAQAQWLLEEEREDEIPALADAWTPPEAAVQKNSLFFTAALRLLGELEVLETDWRDLLARAEQAAEVREEEDLLERIAVYFAFRYLLKAVNDGDFLGRAQLVVFSVLVVERLGAVCDLGEALRRYSSEIEHNEDNLAALLEAFWQQEAFSLERLLSALE